MRGGFFPRHYIYIPANKTRMEIANICRPSELWNWPENLFLFFFCLLCIRFQTQQSEEENRFRIVFRIHSQQQRFDFLSFLLALIQILRLLGEFNSHSLHSACFGKQQMPKNQREFVYYYIKGIFIFLLSDILRWKYAVWRCTSVVKKTGLRPYRYV